jgi:hypothetical protein
MVIEWQGFAAERGRPQPSRQTSSRHIQATETGWPCNRQSNLSKSEIYLECAPLFARGLVRLPNHPKLLRELRLLERRVHRSGKDSVDHGRNGHDDHANAVCGVLQLLSGNTYVHVELWKRAWG